MGSGAVPQKEWGPSGEWWWADVQYVLSYLEQSHKEDEDKVDAGPEVDFLQVTLHLVTVLKKCETVSFGGNILVWFPQS